MSAGRVYHLAAGGDVFLRTQSGVSPFAPEILEIFESAEVGWLNLESPITSHDFVERKAMPLHTTPQHAKSLCDINTKIIVNLANNHILDCGLTGFQDTVEILKSSEIGYVGLLQNSPSQEPYLVELNCGKIAILGYTVGGKTIDATGIADLNEAQIIADIKRSASNNANRVVVCLHWGSEYTNFPSPTQQRMARALIDAGADVIVGTHPHIVQGIERYKSGVIFYSLGNFNFHTTFDESYPHTDWGMIALINFSPKNIEFEVVPVKINPDYRVEFMASVEQAEFQNYLARISTGLPAGISSAFWFGHASVPYLRSSLQGFRRRIENYGWSHFWAMMRWLFHPRTYPYYLGLLLRMGQLAVRK